MSRIGKLPIPVPAGVSVKVDDHNLVVVKGPKGTLALPSEWTSLPGGKENAHRLTGDKKPMDMAYFQTLFDQYLDEEKAKG